MKRWGSGPWLLALGVGWLGGAGPAHARLPRTESGSPALHWNFDQYLAAFQPDQNPSTRAIRFHLGTTPSVRGVQANEWNAVRAAFGQWQSIPGTKIQFEEGSPISNPSNVSVLDGHNDVVWLSPGTYGNSAFGETISFGSGTIAFTVLALDQDDQGQTSGTIVESDILVNHDLDYVTEFDGTSANNPFLESVVLHEIGHLLGMNHSPIGSATMWWFQGGGVGPAAGLSGDEVAYAKSAYGWPATVAGTGTIQGSVHVNGSAVLGAMVFAERKNGLVEAGTVTSANGRFSMPGLPPDRYRLRVQALDPNSGNDSFLVRGFDLDVSSQRLYANGTTAFMPLLDSEFDLAAGAVVERSLAPASGNPPFRITEIRVGFKEGDRSSADQPIGLTQGQGSVWVGVYLPQTLPPDTVLRITGDGLLFGNTEVVRPSLRSLTLVQTLVTVLPDATPGMRSVQVTANGFTASAVGFVDVAAAAPDYNFDGLDDRFQRKYFRPFTRPEAAPEADPDADGFVNRREAARGSDPTDPSSHGYRVISAKLSANGTMVTWESAAGHRYQLLGRDDLVGGGWESVGGVVTAVGETAQALDARPTAHIRLYRVQDAP